MIRDHLCVICIVINNNNNLSTNNNNNGGDITIIILVTTITNWLYIGYYYYSKYNVKVFQSHFWTVFHFNLIELQINCIKKMIENNRGS